MVNKTTQSLRLYGWINHTHLCKRIRRTLSLLGLNPNWKPVRPTATVLVWGLEGEVYVSVSTCFGAKRGFTAPKNHVYLPWDINPANIMGLYRTNGHSGDWSLNFNHLCKDHLEICQWYASVNKTLRKFHLCINLQNRKNALWTPM